MYPWVLTTYGPQNSLFSVTNSDAIYEFSAFFLIKANAGYGGLGFTTSSPTDPNSFGSPSQGIGMGFHGGGGFFVNNSSNTNVSWPPDLVLGNWYKMILRIERTAGSNDFDCTFWIYNADSSGNVGSLKTEKQQTLTNADMANANQIYVYFSAAGSRMEKIDNFEYTLQGGTSVIEEGEPVVATNEPTNVTANGADLSGEVIDDGGAAVTSRGFSYATTSNPTIGDNVVNVGSGTGTFNTALNGLTENTTYYVRAYATNSTGTSYGAEYQFTTLTNPASYSVSTPNLTIAENSGTDTFTIVLDNQPLSDVVFDVSSNDTNEATVDLAQLTFTFANWDTPQTVTVTGVDDAIDRNDSATITIAVNDAGSDDAFDTLADQTVAITLTDDDAAAYMVSETTLTLDENGGTATFIVVLDTEPTSDVVLDVSSDDTSEATVDLSQLTFTPANWNTPQTVTVTGVDDTIDRNDSATITIAVNDAVSDDAFDALADQTVAITLTDDDTAAYMVSETTLTLDENGGTATFTVVLDTEPTSDVVLDVSSDDTNEATVDLAQLTFTSANWDTPQTVTVTGVDDAIDRNDSATITIMVNDAGSDDAFDALIDETVAITLTDDDIELTYLTISSDNSSPEWAKAGDRVSIDFAFANPVEDAVVQVFGATLAFDSNPNNGGAYQGWVTVDENTDEGLVTFTLTVNTGSNNLQYTTTTDGSNVTVDTTAPVPSLVIAESLYFGPFNIELHFSEPIENLAPSPISVVPEKRRGHSYFGCFGNNDIGIGISNSCDSGNSW